MPTMPCLPQVKQRSLCVDGSAFKRERTRKYTSFIDSRLILKVDLRGFTDDLDLSIEPSRHKHI